jgi:hypothetical protein
VALAAVCLAGVVICVVAYVSHVRLDRAFGQFQAHPDFGRGLRDLRASQSSLNPNLFRDVGLAYSLLALHHPLAAERTIAAAARREPRDVRGWIGLTRIQVSRSRLAAARVSWERARGVDPHLQRELPDGSPFASGGG